MAKIKAHLTFRDEPFEIDEDELEALQSQGVVRPAPEADPKPDTATRKQEA